MASAYTKSFAWFGNLSLRLKILLLTSVVSIATLLAGFSYFAYQSYWLNVQTALGGLMNFTDAKQQGVIRFIDQNEKLARQLAELAGKADSRILRGHFKSIVSTDVFSLEEHPFKAEITAQNREIPTWEVYHAIDYVVRGRIVVSSDPQREGRMWALGIKLGPGYSDPHLEDGIPVMTFASQASRGTVYVHVDARMLTNIVNGEIGNLAGDMGAFYLAGVGRTFDYYIVNRENLLITESRTRPGQLMKGHGSELPWRTTLQQAGVICGNSGTYTTDARCTTGCRETMGYYIGHTGKQMLGTSMPFYDSQWTLVVEQEADELLMPMWTSLAYAFGILFAMGMLGIYLTLRLIDKFVIAPIHALQASIKDVESTRFGKQSPIHYGDEIGELGKDFNVMSGKLRDIYRTLEEKVEERTRELNVSNEQLLEEINEREFIEKALRESNEYMRVAAVAFETDEAIVITNKDGDIVRVNQAFHDITGFSAEEVIGKNPRILSSGRHSKEFYAEMWAQLLGRGKWSGEVWDRRKNGEIYPKWLTITAVRNDEGETTEYVAIFSDITLRKKAEDEIRNLAFYDALTGLPNRRLLMDRLEAALIASGRSGQYGAILFLDMDRFKVLNDTLGHDLGDIMLIEVARRIKSCVREVDTVSRLGGDEFIVLLEDVEADAGQASRKAAQIAEKVRSSLSKTYQLEKLEYHSSPSIGVCLFKGNDESLDALLKHADMAMYQAKDAGRNAVRFYDPAMQEAVESRALIESELRRALPEGQLRLYFQIQVDNEGRPIGAEALIRWLHPEKGMIPPMQFIPIAEESSLILEIGHWVLETACKQLAAWSRNEKTRNLILAVNVSAAQFKKMDFVPAVSLLLKKHQVDPTLLKLELTEAVVLEDAAEVAIKMQALQDIGVQLSLDDFGTGYSSLSYLKKLPLDQIKIDQSFVRDIGIDAIDAVMVETIINMAKAFQLHVIAEGVETEDQLRYLKQMGCMAYQGYLFSRPIPIDEFEALLQTDGPSAALNFEI